ncbi:MAG: NUDIX hydrolase [Patescibacteria group bacterium]|nr:NUDIX hydrolase [Patescibacteria group bacterium]
MELQVGVKILLQNKDGKYLLVRRSPEKYPEIEAKNSWGIVGGRITPGSPLFENLKREVKEETELELTQKPKLIAAQDILRISGRHVVRLTYLGSVDGEPKLDEENIDFQWLSRDELTSAQDLDIYFRELLDKGAFF